MTRRKIDWAIIDDAAAAQEQVLTHRQLRELGLSLSTVTRWIGPHGRWQRILPGVVLTHRGTPTRRERLLGALLFAGHGAVITGPDALAAKGVPPAAPSPVVQVLVPTERQRKSFDYVRIERTRRLPIPTRVNGIPYAPPARATLDTCRTLTQLDDVRRVVADVVQRRVCSAAEIRHETLAAERQRTAMCRVAAREVHSGIRSVAEARAREIIIRAEVPSPVWNAQLVLADGTTLCTPDAYWPDLAAALEIDSLAWHLSPASYRRTKRRERLLTSAGVLVISFTPTEILDDPEGFARQVREFLATAARRPVPDGIRVQLPA